MSLRGLRPVVEIMFGDFLTLIADQMINSLTKFHWMYNQSVDVPVVIRTPMGGRRGYGPTHSQTLEKHFIGVPGLRVLAPTAFGNPGELLKTAILEDNHPVLFVENKLLYLQKTRDRTSMADLEINEILPSDGYAPTYKLTIRDAPPPTITLAAYGYMAEVAREAVIRLAYEQEIFAELIVPTQLAPFPPDQELPSGLLESLHHTHRLIAVEEGNLTLGWGAEVLARATATLGSNLKAAQRVAAADTPIPASVPLEEGVLPGVEDILQTAIMMV